MKHLCRKASLLLTGELSARAAKQVELLEAGAREATVKNEVVLVKLSRTPR